MLHVHYMIGETSQMFFFLDPFPETLWTRPRCRLMVRWWSDHGQMVIRWWLSSGCVQTKQFVCRCCYGGSSVVVDTGATVLVVTLVLTRLGPGRGSGLGGVQRRTVYGGGGARLWMKHHWGSQEDHRKQPYCMNLVWQCFGVDCVGDMICIHYPHCRQIVVNV